MLGKIKKLFDLKIFKNSRIMLLVMGSVIIASLTVYSVIANFNAAQVAAKFAQEGTSSATAAPNDGENVTIETAEVDIPFSETRKVNTGLTAGEQRIAQKGVNGKRIETYQVTYVNGQMQDKTLISDETVVAPITQVVETGGASITLSSRSGEDTGRYSKSLTMTATAYSGCKACTGSDAGITATGLVAKKGVVAVDPSVIPLGSHVYVVTADGSYIYGTAIAADTGSAIKGNKIDLCFDSYQEAVNFGKQTVEVYIQ